MYNEKYSLIIKIIVEVLFAIIAIVSLVLLFYLEKEGLLKGNGTGFLLGCSALLSTIAIGINL